MYITPYSTIKNPFSMIQCDYLNSKIRYNFSNSINGLKQEQSVIQRVIQIYFITLKIRILAFFLYFDFKT